MWKQPQFYEKWALICAHLLKPVRSFPEHVVWLLWFRNHKLYSLPSSFMGRLPKAMIMAMTLELYALLLTLLSANICLWETPNFTGITGIKSAVPYHFDKTVFRGHANENCMVGEVKLFSGNLVNIALIGVG